MTVNNKHWLSRRINVKTFNVTESNYFFKILLL